MEIGFSVGSCEPKDLPSVFTFCRTQAFYPFNSLSPQGSGIALLGFSASKTRMGKAQSCLVLNDHTKLEVLPVAFPEWCRWAFYPPHGYLTLLPLDKVVITHQLIF